MQNSMVKFTLYVFGWKYTFSANLVQKIKEICYKKWKLFEAEILNLD